MVTESIVLERIEAFLSECEQSQIVPTTVYMGKLHANILKKNFPHLFSGDCFVSKEFGIIKLILTEGDYLGVGLVFDDEDVLSSTIEELKIGIC